MYIKVTKNDILKGSKTSAKRCAVALAIKNTLGVKNVYVSDDTIRYDTKDGNYTWQNPRSVSRFINNVIKGNKVKSFTFRLTNRHLLSSPYVETNSTSTTN